MTCPDLIAACDAALHHAGLQAENLDYNTDEVAYIYCEIFGCQETFLLIRMARHPNINLVLKFIFSQDDLAGHLALGKCLCIKGPWGH